MHGHSLAHQLEMSGLRIAAEKNAVLNLRLKIVNGGADMTLEGRSFHARAAATRNARLPNVDSQ
jgi:hypothetical protein